MTHRSVSLGNFDLRAGKKHLLKKQESAEGRRKKGKDQDFLVQEGMRKCLCTRTGNF